LETLEYTLNYQKDGNIIEGKSFIFPMLFILSPIVVEKHMQGEHEWKSKVIGVPSNKVVLLELRSCPSHHSK
jgi:hypothetical protein